MKPENGERLDIARGRSPAPTPRMIRAGALLAEGKARSTGEALVAVGYSPATARNPRQNNLSPERLLREAVEAGQGGDVLRSLRRPALETLRELITDPLAPPGVRAPAALGALKLIHDQAADGEDALTAEDHLEGERFMARWARIAIRVGDAERLDRLARVARRIYWKGPTPWGT